MELIKDFFGFFLNMYVYYAEFIRMIFSLIISNKSYLDFFMIYTTYLIPAIILFKRICKRNFLTVFFNITIHIYVFIMTTFALILNKDMILRDINGDTTDLAKLAFIWLILTMYGIQTIANRVSVIQMAGKRISDYNDKKNRKFYKTKK